MKKFASILVVLALVLALCVPAWAEEEKVVVGSLARLGKDEEELQNHIDAVRGDGENDNRERVYFHSLSEMLMALDAGLIDRAKADEPTVQYVLSRNDAYAERHSSGDLHYEYNLCFLEEDVALRDRFDTAIAAMQEDGTLDALAKAHIDDVIAGAEPEAVEFPSFDGADSVTVAVTGDLPPMDYVDDAGNAAGFNTAVLAEIAKRLEINIELIQVDSGARALALSSGRADVVFWVKSTVRGENADLPENAVANSDIPEGVVISAPYYSAEMCNLVLKDAE